MAAMPRRRAADGSLAQARDGAAFDQEMGHKMVQGHFVRVICLTFFSQLAAVAVVAAQRQVDVVPQPLRKGHMPAAPKFCKVTREVGKIKIRGKLYTKETTYTTHNAGISSKVIIDGKSIQYQPG